jgi:hypothetical protein
MSLRGGGPDPRFDEPSEGLPPWLKGHVLEWVDTAFLPGGYENEEALRALQLDFRLERPLGADGATPRNDLIKRMYVNDEFALDVLDWMVHNHRYFSSGHQSEEWVGELGLLLNQGGSAWEVITVGYMSHRLTRRAVGPVVEVLEQTATEATRAHMHLSEAWSKLMGREPDPSGAYREAVRAVEAVAKPVILPDNDRATLGQMIAAMREKPEKWTTTIGTVDDVRAQMEAVWTGQLDRHGTDDEAVPLNVSQAEADAAFSTCLNLVRLYAGGHVVRVPQGGGSDP